MGKTYAGTYLYNRYNEYEQKIFSFIMEGTEVIKTDPGFEDIRYEIKRRNMGNSLVKLLDSKHVILLIGKDPMARAFKVFCARDVKNPKSDKKKVFIDCTNIITRDPKSGVYVCNRNNIDIFVSYLVSAMHTYIYYVDENRIINNSKIMTVGTQAFATLFTFVVDSACKISSMPSTKNKCMYLASLYYLSNLLGKDHTSDGCRAIAKKVSGLSDREAGLVDIQIDSNTMTNIKFFVETLSDVIHTSKLTLDVVVERWMYKYGPGTVFALELFPAFATMLTDAYVGAYINNQKSIEKIAGPSMVEFTKALLSIGAESV